MFAHGYFGAGYFSSTHWPPATTTTPTVQPPGLPQGFAVGSGSASGPRGYNQIRPTFKQIQRELAREIEAEWSHEGQEDREKELRRRLAIIMLSGIT